MNPFAEDATAKQRVLQNLRVAARQRLPAYVAQTVDAEVVFDHMYRQMAFQLRAFVLGEQLGNREHHVPFSRPASWWQHFKRDVLLPARWIPRRLRDKLGPVRVTVEVKVLSFEDYRTYPDAPIAIPPERMGQPVIISMQTGGWF